MLPPAVSLETLPQILQRCVFQMILNLVRPTTKISHRNYHEQLL